MVHNHNHYKQKIAIWRFRKKWGFPVSLPIAAIAFQRFHGKSHGKFHPTGRTGPKKGLRTHFAVPDLPQILRGSTRVHRSVAAAALAPLRGVVKTLTRRDGGGGCEG